MNYAKLVTDLAKILSDGGALPTFTDRAAVKAYLSKVGPDLVDLVFDAGGLDAVTILCAAQPAGVVPVEAKGDGHILQWIVTNLPTILSTITAIIAMFGKTPVPAPVQAT